MATSKLDLSNLSIVGDKFYVIDANKTNPKYAGNKVDSIKNGTKASGSIVTFEDGSTLTADGKFTAGSGSGTFNIAGVGTVASSVDVQRVVGNAAKIATKAATSSSASDEDGKKKDVSAALAAEADKYDESTLDYQVYHKLATGTSSVSSTGLADDYDKLTLTNIFSSGSAASLTLTDLNFADASGAITADLGSSVTYGGITNVVGSDYADKLTLGGATDSYTVDAGDGNDTVDIASITSGKTVDINLGDGDDVLKIADKVSGSVVVTLGDGADVVNIASSTASVSISDYNYADGDKINLTYDKASDSLNADAVALASITGGNASIKVGNVTATVAATDGVAVADITANKDTVTFYTATKAQAVEINAKGISNKTIIDAAAASTANITLGSGESAVSLKNGGGVDTINATGAKNVTINGFAATDDILVLDGANLNNITLSSDTDNGVLTYGKTTVNLVNLAKGAASVGTIKLNDADTTLAYNLGGKGATMAAGADMYYGHADGNSTVVSSDTVHLADTDKFKNIYNVSVAAGSEAEKLDLSGFTTDGKHGINIDASKADVAVNVWAYNKSKAQDTITLGTNTVQDTVSFVSDDGKVSVAGFGFGAGEESDILYLRDTQDLQKLNVKQGEMKIGSSKLDIGHAANVNDVMQLKLADGTSSLIAGNFDSATAGVVNVTVGDDAIDFYALNGTKNALSVARDGDAEDAVSFKYSNLDDNHTAKTLVKSVTVSKFTEEDEVTIGAVANVTVGTSSATNDSKTHIWVCGAADAGTVDIANSNGADQIDFVSGIDKKVTVTGYDADQEDTIFLRGSEDLKAVTSGYKFESKNGGVQISGADNADSKLVLDGASNLNLKTTNGDALKAIVGTADATFASDTQIYVGMKKIEADTTTEGDIAVRVGTKGAIGLDSSNTYYVSDSVTEFDASNSNAVFHLAGSSTAATTLRGGNTENSFYGGGSFSDTMVGNSSAVDTFYFGKGDGKDTIQEADGKDTVYLMDVSVDDITIDTKTNTIAISTSDTLTFGEGAEDALTAGELTFNIGGSNYVCKAGKMVAKA